jgi:hypothetical protein
MNLSFCWTDESIGAVAHYQGANRNSQTLIVLSKLAVANRFPSGLNATQLTV